MSTTIVNFKATTVSAATLDEAKDMIAEEYFVVLKNATQALKNAKAKHVGTWTERDEKAWMLDYCQAQNRSCPGTGFYIVIESAIDATRERPYQFVNVKNNGKRKYKSTYNFINDRTGLSVGKVTTNQKDAENTLKEMYKSGELKDSVTCRLTKEVVEGTSDVFKATYKPGKNTRPGTWKFFGICK